MNSEIRKTLEAVKNGELSVDDALLAIKKEPFEDIGYAKVDLHRGIRQGAAEVIYGAGKTPEQMTSWDFFDYLLENANVVGTPGSGFGPSGEGYFRLTAFGTYENSVAALERIKAL